MIYIVKAGDTLSGIARAHLGDAKRWPEIARLNTHIENPNVIQPGDELRLPSSGGGLLKRILGRLFK